MKSKSGLAIDRKQGQRYSKRALIFSALTLIIGLGILLYVYNNQPGTTKTKTSLASGGAALEAVVHPPKEAPENIVAPDAPRYLSVPKLAIADVNVLSLGIEPNGELAAPPSNQDVGWYNQSAKPGSGEGAVLIDGHVGGPGQSAVFENLDQLSQGDVMTLERGDGQVFQYIVYFIEQLPMKEVDMRKMLRSVDPGREGLNIITCGGEFDEARDTYTDRVLVYAVRSN